MSKTHTHNHQPRRNQQRRDPTNTTTLRERYAQDVRGRWRRVRARIREAIVENDVFGLRSNNSQNEKMRTNQPNVPGSGAYAFDRDKKKVETFGDWMRTLMNEGVIEPVDRQIEGPQNHWQHKYVRQSVKKGSLQAERGLKNAGFDVEDDDFQNIFNRPIHTQTLNRMWTRQFEYLETKVDSIDQALREELTAGFAQGHNPNKIGRNISQRIDTMGLTDGTTFARTEVIKTHAESTLDTYERLGVKKVNGNAEFITARDNFVCPICESIDGVQFKINQARGMIPQHPRCRCSWAVVQRQSQIEPTGIQRGITGENV